MIVCSPVKIEEFKNHCSSSCITLVDYNIVKHCRWCRARFVIRKGEYKNYCDGCQLKINKEKKDLEGGTK